MSRFTFTGEPMEARVLVYDVETYATGFADPAWVPQVITCVAWKWLAAPETNVSASVDHFKRDHPMQHLDPAVVGQMMTPFFAALDTADAVLTYNGRRFDNPIINAMAFYTGREPLQPVPTYDLHAFGKVKGLKKGLDNLAVFLGVPHDKQAMSHSQWQAAYLERGWPLIKSRAASDVVLTEELYGAMKAQGWLKPARKWLP